MGLVNLVLRWSEPGSGDWSPPGPLLDLVKSVATCASPGPCDCGPTWNSPGSGGSGYHRGVFWTWFLWSPSGLTWNTMTVIHIWAFPGPVDSGPKLGIISNWILSYIPSPHLDLVTVVPPGPHLDLVTQVLIWASWDLGSQVHIGASPGPSDSRPPLGLTLT